VALSRLSDIPTEARVLIDANIFVYAANGNSHECEEFLQRCSRQELRGITTFEILSETCHRLMIDEAMATRLISRPSVSQLRNRPDTVSKLGAYWRHLSLLLNLNILRLPLDEGRFRDGQPLRQAYGLLTNDSFLLAGAVRYAINHLATNDTDFERVPWLTVYKPGDIP
jgi:predicted nucleic acid-binding protein